MTVLDYYMLLGMVALFARFGVDSYIQHIHEAYECDTLGNLGEPVLSNDNPCRKMDYYFTLLISGSWLIVSVIFLLFGKWTLQVPWDMLDPITDVSLLDPLTFLKSLTQSNILSHQTYARKGGFDMHICNIDSFDKK